MSDETVTILFPVYDQRREFLEASVQSVFDQTSSRWRLAVAIDRSSPSWLRDWFDALEDPRVSVATCDEPGLGHAFNTLMRAADTPFVCTLLSDDRLDRKAVETVLRHRKAHPDVDFFHSARRYIDAQGRPISKILRPTKTVTLDQFLRDGSPVKHLMCWRLELALALGGMHAHLSAHGCDDYDFPWRMAEHGARFRAIPNCLYEYRVHTLGPRLTLDTGLQAQVDVLQTMFREHRASEPEVTSYLDRAVDSYLVHSHLGQLEGERLSLYAVRHREANIESLGEFERRGFARRHVFPHRVYLINRPGPDGMYYATRMCGAQDISSVAQLVLFATPPATDDLPEDLFFDDQVLWHQQHLGLPGQVAHANLVQLENRLHVTLAQSDLVQRVSRRRESKTRVESRFKGWPHMLLNAALNVAIDRGLDSLFWPTSESVLAHADPTRDVDPAMFERVYDLTAQVRGSAIRSGDWWQIDIATIEPRIVPLHRAISTVQREKLVAVFHDTERSLGHTQAQPDFVEEADRVSPAALDAMLEVEGKLGVKTTYNVVGKLLPEIREKIETGGHALAFHSFDHVLPPKLPLRERAQLWLGEQLHGPKDRTEEPEYWQLARCREIDYRLKGYRPPQSRVTAGVCDANLLDFNFEWLASSAYSLGRETPTFEGGLAKIPIHLDDFDLHRDRLRYDQWESRLLALVDRLDFVAVGLHDCYGPRWLPKYEDLLTELGQRARLVTLDEVAAGVTLEHTRWR